MAIRTIVHTEANVMIMILANGPKELSTTAYLSIEEASELRDQLDSAIGRAENWKADG
jgi:hypothetical protein